MEELTGLDGLERENGLILLGTLVPMTVMTLGR